jgi:uroporphyrinogen-III decarboxylase
MNSRERMATAMRMGEPDRVPVMCQLSLGHYFLQAGLPPHRIWFTSEGFVEALMEIRKRYRFDGILINLPGRPENLLDSVISIEQTRDGELLTWRDGHTTLVPPDDNPQHSPPGSSKLDVAALEALDPDDLSDIDQYSDYLWNTYHIHWLEDKTGPGPLSEIPPYFFRTLEMLKAEVGDEISIHGETLSPFTHFVELIGYENSLMSLMTDEAKAKALLQRLTEASLTWALAQAERGVDALLISSAFVGGGFISPQMYRDFVMPYERQVVDAVKAIGVPVYTHTCGRIGDRLELMEETGTMGIDTLDPPPLGDVDLAAAKDMIGDRMFIKGNMDSVALLGYKTREEVIAHASERIRVGKPGGGYILSTACSVSPHVEPWKLELMTPLAEKMGRY